MALTPDIQAPQLAVQAVTSQVADGLLVPQMACLAVYNFPTPFDRVSQLSIVSVTLRNTVIDISQLMVQVVTGGRIANPRVRAWTFTLDGHDFYVLRLGDSATWIYDNSTQQWMKWDGLGLSVWPLDIGMTWIGGQNLGNQFGSNIIVGDDTLGILWILDPETPYDENFDIDGAEQSFTRMVTGQVLANGRQYIPCYAIFLSGDNYGLTAGDFAPTVVLETSDDQGRNYVAHDVLMVNPDLTVNNPYGWYSLGQINSPGRMFRITDNGVFSRIDSLEMNDDAG